MENIADKIHAGFLYGAAGRTLVDLTAHNSMYQMKDGDRVIHINAMVEGVIYLPSTVGASGNFYSLTSLSQSTNDANLYTREKETLIISLPRCTTALYYCDGLCWYEIDMIFKS